MSILRDVEIIKSTDSGDETEICHRVVYYVVDSWGTKHTDKTCKHIIKNLEDSFNMANFNHATHMSTFGKCCVCEFEINFPVHKRIQHATFENCGWYALLFSDMSKNTLMKWANLELNDYGQIKPNYRTMTEYFRYHFFPMIVQSCHIDYVDYKMKTLDTLPKCKCNQNCHSEKFCEKYF